ncbi:MAG: FecR family protein [Gemmatimonadaceae bacterium]
MANSEGDSPPVLPEDWDRIARYLAGEGDPQEIQATRAWLEADANRLKMVNALRIALVNASPEEPAELDVESALARVKSRLAIPRIIPGSLRTNRLEKSNTFTPYLRAAAALLVVVGAGLLWQRVHRADSGSKIFATSVGERHQFQLNDGTRVVLGPTSRLVVEDGSDNRSVALEGEGYFSVVHDASHPFTVRVGSMSVEDVGTAFAIQTDDSGGVRVAVDSGVVALVPDQAGPESKEILNARDRASVNPNGLVLVERSAVVDDDLAWVQGRLVFRDAPLIQVGAELYRWYGVRLRVADSSLANLHLTASFSGESVDRVLNVIALSLGAHLERQGNVATLSRADASSRHR